MAASRPLTIALLGAECTGKSTLSQALAQHLLLLQAPCPKGEALPVLLVPECLRAWCERTGRTPQAHEQADLAQAQTQAIAQAQQCPGVHFVLADTTALTIAAYSEHYFDDASLYADALRQQAGYDLTLLMGLDLPWTPDGLHRDGPADREAVDGLLRRQLGAAGLAYRLVYGQGEARTRSALHAMAALPGLQALAMPETRSIQTRPWTCEQCSDPDCERRLFSQLLAHPDRRA